MNNTIQTIYVDIKYNQFDLLSPNKFHVISDKNNFVIDSSKIDNNIYVVISRSSWFSSKQNVIKMIRTHDLDMLNELQKFGFIVPNYIYTNDVSQLFKHMKFNQKYLLKSFDSARTLGQSKVTKETIRSMLSFVHDHSASEFNKKYNIDNSTAKKNEQTKLYDSIIKHGVYISEEIDFIAEYRILYFRGTAAKDFLIEYREGYQTNSKIKRFHKVQKLKNTKLSLKFLKKLKSFGDSHSSPMLSFDVFVDKNGNFGLFEFSVEFGTDYEGYYELLQVQIERAMKQEIERFS